VDVRGVVVAIVVNVGVDVDGMIVSERLPPRGSNRKCLLRTICVGVILVDADTTSCIDPISSRNRESDGNDMLKMF